MLFRWLRDRRRRLLRNEPFPPEWEPIMRQAVPGFASLSEAEQGKLRDDLRILAAEKNWEGCAGFEITDEVRVTITARAGLLILGRGIDDYDRVESILVYPDSFMAPRVKVTPDGVVHESEEAYLGEAWYRGPVILSWTDIAEEVRGEARGRNLVAHEFAHQIDMLDGCVNGTPPLPDSETRSRWHEVMSKAFRDLQMALERGKGALLPPQAAEDEGEFFAAITESFLETPAILKAREPNAYRLLREFYEQDPAARDKRG